MSIWILISHWLLLTSINFSDLSEEKDEHLETFCCCYPYNFDFYRAVRSLNIRGKGRQKKGGDRGEKMVKEMQEMQEWHYRRTEMDGDMTVTRRGRGESSKAEQTLEWECDRERKRRAAWKKGEGGRGRDASWVKALKLPWFLCERHSAEKIDNVCPHYQGMPKTMTSLSSNYQGHEARAQDSHLDLLFIIIHSLIHHFPSTQTLHWHSHQVPILKNLHRTKIVLSLLRTVRLSLFTDSDH